MTSQRLTQVATAGAAMLALVHSIPAQATTDCGPALIAQMITHTDGNVMILAPWRDDWTYICNLNGAWKGVPGQTCWSWVAQISNAISDGRKIGFYYGAISYTCGQLGTYANAPAPLYLRLEQ